MSRPLRLVAKTVIVVLFLATLGVLAAHIRLSAGPMSLKFLVAPIEQAINSDLSGMTVEIGDAVMRRTDGWTGIEFQLANVRLQDGNKQLIAQAPAAAVRLSRRALMLGRIAADRVDLIRPRLHLFYSAESGMTLSFQRTGESNALGGPDAPAIQPSNEPAASVKDLAASGTLQQVDLAATLADTIARARRRDGSASFLSTLGVREAVLVIEHKGRQSVWRVPEFSIGLDHRQKRSTIAGAGTINAGTGPWSLRFQADDAEKNQTLKISAEVKDLVPRGIAANLPLLSSLQVIDAPMAGEGTIELTRDGRVLVADLTVAIAKGRIVVPVASMVPLPFDEGRIVLHQSSADRHVEVSSAKFRWPNGHLSLQGRLTPGPEDAATSSWDFALASSEGAIVSDLPERPEIPIEQLTLTGQVVPDRVVVLLENLSARIGGASATLAGTFQMLGGTPQVSLDGVGGPVSLETVKALWPAGLANDARIWVRANVKAGKILGGKLKLQTGGAGATGETSSLTAEASDVVFNIIDTLPAVEIPKCSIKVTDRRVEITAAEASVTTQAGRKLLTHSGRFLIADHRPKVPDGEVTFKLQGPVAGAIEFLDLPPFGAIKSTGLPLDTLDGKLDGQARLTMPISPQLTPAGVRFEGKARLTDLRAKGIIGSIDLLGGSLAMDVTDKQAEAKGDLLLNGVPAKLTWLRPLRDAADRPSIVRLTGHLDNAYREQLGIKVNHIVSGDMPVELTVQIGGDGVPRPHLHADLAQTELYLENFAWKKAQGRRATFDVNLAKGQIYKTELQNFKVVGDDIAIEGWAALGADQTFKAFYFPDFSINVITKLDVSGQLRDDNVWDVKAKGATYDGRQLFRSMFSAGTMSDKHTPPRDQAGLDLKADVDTVVGFSDTLVHGFNIKLKKRAGKIVELSAHGEFPGDAHPAVAATIQQAQPGGARTLRAESADAGSAFRLIGFYPNVKGGKAALEVNLDGRGAAEKDGTLWARKFYLLGDPVVTEVLANANSPAEGTQKGGKRVSREEVYFERLRMPFLVGRGQLLLDEAQINGPALGATLKGKVDFDQHQVNLAGTYVPLYGLNAAIAPLPILGDIFTGGQGKGVFGVTFAVTGQLANPQVVVNPLSAVAPGFLQGLFDMMPNSQQINERDGAKPVQQSQPKSSASDAMTGPAPPNSNEGRTVRARSGEAASSWSTETTKK